MPVTLSKIFADASVAGKDSLLRFGYWSGIGTRIVQPRFALAGDVRLFKARAASSRARSSLRVSFYQSCNIKVFQSCTTELDNKLTPGDSTVV